MIPRSGNAADDAGVPGSINGADGPSERPAHWLAAAWAPDPRQPALYPRLPEIAAIGSPDARRALDEMFVHLPVDVAVLMVGGEHVDLASAAEMVLVADRNLARWQREALQVFVERYRAHVRAAIADSCTDRDAGFDRFRAKVVGRN